MTKNPRLFSGTTKKGKKFKGLSVNVKRIEGLGKKLFLEASFYNEAMSDAKRLKLKTGDRITFCGRYNTIEGKTVTFRKVSVNDPKQVELFHKRPAKSTEI